MRRRGFIGAESGTLLPLYALSMLPVLALVGAAIDYTGADRSRSILQAGVDAAALAVTRGATTQNIPALQTLADYYFREQVGKALPNAALAPVSVDLANGTVRLSASATVKTRLLPTLGIESIPISASASTRMGDRRLELALVLDNSGSMAGSKITALKEAATQLTNTLFSADTSNSMVKIAVVPFSGSVNVGPVNATASWMDTQGLSSIHAQNFAIAANRFTLFSQMRDTSWAGCVEVRPQPYDVTDETASITTPDTLFVPMFAPDEPDSAYRTPTGSTISYANNYLSDTGGDCTASSPGTAQSKVCKYKNATPNTTSSGSTRRGPNFWCDSQPILPLTSTKSAVTGAISQMVARGYTNIPEGFMWGWRVLSPEAPFTEGAAWSDTVTEKFIILMTDGENTINGRGASFPNLSDYSAHGYAVKGRLGVASGSSSTLKTAMDGRLALACSNAKAKGIRVYTIAFGISDTATRNMLSACATKPSMAYTPSSTTELTPLFQAIALEIGRLRLVN